MFVTPKHAGLVGALLALLALACGDGGTAPDPPSITPKDLQPVSGDGQKAARGAPLAAPLRARVIGTDNQPLALQSNEKLQLT
jgi:hypothetical protein